MLAVNLFSWFISTISGLLLAFLSFRTGFLAGADCKAIITVGFIYPYEKNTGLFFFESTPPIVEVYFIFLVLTSLIPISTLFYNLATGNYKNLPHVKFSSKIKILTSYRGVNSKKNLNDNIDLTDLNSNSKALISLDNFLDNTILEKSEHRKAIVNHTTSWVYYKQPLIPLLLLSLIIKFLVQLVIINV